LKKDLILSDRVDSSLIGLSSCGIKHGTVGPEKFEYKLIGGSDIAGLFEILIYKHNNYTSENS
jgi:hypothetical protein